MNKVTLSFMLCSMLWTANSSAAIKDTIEVKSKISDVNVFFEGARVTRKFQKDLSPGKYTLSVKGLPLNLDQELIKVKTPRGVKILAVSHKVVTPSKRSIKEDLDSIEKQRVLLDDEISWLKAKKDIFAEEEALLIQNTELKQAEGEIHTQGVREAADFLRERMTEIARMKYDNTLAIRKAQEKKIKLNALENRLKSGTETPQTQLLVFVEVESLNNGKMKLEYFTQAAGWEPLYDLRFEGVNKPLQLAYNAKVYQSTGENWDEVKLTLIEGLPKQSTVLPEFERFYITRKKRNYTQTSTKTFSGTGTLKGTLKDAETGEPLPFVNILLEQQNRHVNGSSTDFDGNYTIKPIPNGIYDVVVSYVGYNARKVEGVQINNNKITFVDIELYSGVQLDDFEVIEYTVPLIDKDGGSSGGTITRENIDKLRGRGPNSVAARVGGVRLNGTSIRGAREASTYYSINGVKIRGNAKPLAASVFLDDTPSISSPRISYNIDANHSVPSTGEDKLLTIKMEEVQVEFLYRAIPKVDTDVFLLAKIIDWGNLDLLSGKSTIYFQGAYTGESRLEAWSVEDTLEIALGRDENILLERKLNEELSKKQNMGSKIKHEIVWEITVRNNKEHAVMLELVDQLPLSDNKNVTIEPFNLSEANYKEGSGKLTWEIELKPNSSEKVEFSYELKYPSNARIYN
ncbi:MAG: mucoidy inhibitor MuiA family protein [Flavobacteriales bacterium]|nr:mucoidy inhibitor MuiA family protein [Flavobacteriales bacterium]